MDFESDDPIQLEFDKKNDHLNLEKDPQIKEIISNEKFLFSDLIYKKINSALINLVISFLLIMPFII